MTYPMWGIEKLIRERDAADAEYRTKLAEAEGARLRRDRLQAVIDRRAEKDVIVRRRMQETLTGGLR